VRNLGGIIALVGFIVFFGALANRFLPGLQRGGRPISKKAYVAAMVFFVIALVLGLGLVVAAN